MQRENRYIVIKNKDIEAAEAAGFITPAHAWLIQHIAGKLALYRHSIDKIPLECVVVESDWPEYEPVWNMIAARVDGVNNIRQQHAEWSDATFGNVGPIGPLKHLSKEALEAAAQPSDLSEWADMQFLFWDALRRAGITDEQLNQAMEEKLAINKARSWPEPKDGEAREHIRDQGE